MVFTNMKKTLTTCPNCMGQMEVGFWSLAAPASFVAPEKFDRFLFRDEDVFQVGLKKLLPSRAEFFQSYLCRTCKIYIIDYSHTFNRVEAEETVQPISIMQKPLPNDSVSVDIQE